MTRRYLLSKIFLIAAGWMVLSAAGSRDVKIAEYLPMVQFVENGKIYTIDRIQDKNHVLTGGFAKTSRPCPPFCIHPMHAAPGVTTVGEIELLEFLKNKVEKGTGILIDARLPSWYAKGTIPGAVNIPFTTFALPENDPKLAKTLKRLGATKGYSVNWSDSVYHRENPFGQTERRLDWDFSHAKDVLLFCNGPWCDQSPRAIRGLVRLGYPVNKIYYYRGGMQLWTLLGLTVLAP